MKLLKFAAAAAMLVTMGAAAPAGVACAQDGGTCHERCQIGCYELYPDNVSAQQFCTYICIDRECGGGDFP